jgi:hypothetical protein
MTTAQAAQIQGKKITAPEPASVAMLPAKHAEQTKQKAMVHNAKLALMTQRMMVVPRDASVTVENSVILAHKSVLIFVQ